MISNAINEQVKIGSLSKFKLRLKKQYLSLLKTGSLDNAIREFSLAKPSWYVSHYTMTYKNGARMRVFLGLFGFIAVWFSIFWGRF